MGAKTSQRHHLLGRSRVAYSIALSFNPKQQLLGLVGPCTQCGAQQFVIAESCFRNGGWIRRRFQQGVELLMAQRVRNKRIRIDA